MARYKRITKKNDIKSPDEFISFWQHAFMYASEKGEKLLFPVIGIAVAAMLVLGFFFYQQQKNRMAQSELYDILKDLPRPGAAAAVSGQQLIENLKAYDKKYSGTGSARFEKLYRANLLFQNNGLDEAASLYKELMGDDLVGQLASVNYAAVLRQQGKFADGNAVLEKLRQNSFFTEEADYQIARNYELMGNAQKARAEYERFLTTHQRSHYADEARSRKDRLS